MHVVESIDLCSTTWPADMSAYGCVLLFALLQVHMNALVPFTDRPPGELISELSALSAARVIGYDQSTQVQALAWRIIRQPEDWEGLVEDVYMRVNRVRQKC